MGVDNINNIFPFIVDGIPHSKEDIADECFPQALIDLPTELIAGDVIKHGREHAFVKILSGTLHYSGVSFSMLWNQFERDRIEAECKEREQKDNLLRTQSLFLAEKANNLINNNDYDIANLIALEALPSNLEYPNRPYVKEVEEVLRKSAIHTSPIIRSEVGCCIQTNGNIVITSDPNYKLLIWKIHNGELVKNIKLEDSLKSPLKYDYIKKRWIKAITFSACTNKIYICAVDALYDLDYHTEQLQLIHKINDYIDNGNIIVSPKGHYYIWLFELGNIDAPIYHMYLYDSFSNEELLYYSYTSSVSCSFSPNSKLVAFACHHNVHVIDIESKDCISKYRFYDVISCTFIDDTNILIICSDKTIRLWNILSHEDKIIRKSDSDILGVLYKDNILAYITSSDNIIMDIRYNLSINQLEWSKPIQLLSFSNDGKLLYFRDNNSFRIWDFYLINDGSRLLYYHDNPIDCITYSNDTSWFVSVSNESINILDIEKRRVIKSFVHKIKPYIYEIVVSKKYNRLFLSSDMLYCLDFCSGNLISLAEENRSTLFISIDEKYLVKTCDNTLTLYEVDSLTIYKEIKFPKDQNLLWGKSIAFHPYESLLVTATSYTYELDHSAILTIWDYNEGVPITSVIIENYYSGEEEVYFSNNGNSVILSNCLGNYFMWNFRLNELQKKEDSALSLSPNINYTIEQDGCFIVERKKISLQELMDQTRRYLGNRKLTLEERRTYYLDENG